MAGRQRPPRDHHWWPVALQKYWADKSNDVSWIDPSGEIAKKRYHNRKIGQRPHGHTLFRGDKYWRSQFETEFDIDNDVHAIISSLGQFRPLGRQPSDFISLLKLIVKRRKPPLRALCKFYHIDEPLNRKLLLLIYSLLIRSPGNRSRYENYPSMVGLPRNEEVGKINMAQKYRLAKRLCETGVITNRFFVLLHSPLKRFILGDGYLDWMTDNLTASRIAGKTLIPITPHLCIYVSTPMSMRTDRNCAALSAAPWMVDWINRITQIYSRDQLFFRGRPPKLTEHFRKAAFLVHDRNEDALLDQLDDIVSWRNPLLAMPDTLLLR